LLAFDIGGTIGRAVATSLIAGGVVLLIQGIILIEFREERDAVQGGVIKYKKKNEKGVS
jgi:hypothetical protein